MKVINLIFSAFAVCFFAISNVSGKEVKPKVLVYGDNIEAFAAAMQSARSNVPTLWVVPSKTFCSGCFVNDNFKMVNDTLGGGIWSSILKEVHRQQNGKDSTVHFTSLSLTPQLVLNAMQSLVAKETNLNVLYDMRVKKVVNSIKNVEVEFINKKKVKVNAVVDISEDLPLLLATDAGFSLQKKQPQYLLEGRFKDLSSNIIRTLVAVGYDHKNQACGYTLESLLNGSVGNIFYSEVNEKNLSSDEDVIYRFNKAQAIGASAAYCAFFKTTSDKIDVRKLQTELMSFDSRLLPFVDVSTEDPNFNSVQKFFLTQILPWDKAKIPLNFNGSDSVSVESVRPVLQQFYSRAQLWFVDNKVEYFKTKDFIELLKVVSFRGNELNDEISKSWKKRFKFPNEFDLNRMISRYEFAVLLETYASPFAKRISFDGTILK